ncbi:MAG: adenine phosphoribosyltransferase [Myxococcales bacterium]|nr:adenine phosphoribosyltransferase [Myxococcales bacterium]
MSIDNEQSRQLLRDRVRSVPDFPSPGILFRDITPVLADPVAFTTAVELHLHHVRDLVGQLDLVVGMESRGFLFGPIIAHRLNLGFVPARKPGKLPAETIEERYDLEYGSNALQVHADAFSQVPPPPAPPPGARVLIVDDLLATGGTAAAAGKLVARLGGRVSAYLFLIELGALGGREALRATDPDARVESLLLY